MDNQSQSQPYMFYQNKCEVMETVLGLETWIWGLDSPVDGWKTRKERKPESRTLENAYFQGKMKEGQERQTYQTWSKESSVLK